MRVTATHRGQPQTAHSGCVVTLLVDRADAARISAALRPLRVRVVTTAVELRRAVREEAPSCIAVIAVGFDAVGEPVGTVLRAIAATLPRVPLLGYCSTREGDALRELALAGVDDLILRDVDDLPTTLRGRIGQGEEARAASTVLARVTPMLATTLWPLAEYVVKHPRVDHSVAHVATVLGVHRKTLVNWSDRAHAPPPRAIIAWCRLLLAAELLQSPGRSVEQVANVLEFASASAFRNLCQRYFGATPSELRDEQTLRKAYAAFAQAVEGPDPTAPPPGLGRAESAGPGLHLSRR